MTYAMTDWDWAITTTIGDATTMLSRPIDTGPSWCANRDPGVGPHFQTHVLSLSPSKYAYPVSLPLCVSCLVSASQITSTSLLVSATFCASLSTVRRMRRSNPAFLLREPGHSSTFDNEASCTASFPLVPPRHLPCAHRSDSLSFPLRPGTRLSR